MNSNVRDIKITVHWDGTLYSFDVYQNEYRNLMTLIYDKIYIENFGDCKGIGRCGTCHVHVLKAEPDALKREIIELSTLGKMELTSDRSRLSCQMLIDKNLNGVIVEVIHEGELGLY